MAWTNLSFSFEQVLTSSEMNQLQANFAAMAAGDSGAPAITALGNFSSPGIDDNATSNVLTLNIDANTSNAVWTPAAGDPAFTQQLSLNNRVHYISGGTDSNIGANITLWGGAHATQAHDFRFRAAATTVFNYDHSANIFSIPLDDFVVGGTTAGAALAATLYATGKAKFSQGASGATADTGADVLVVESLGNGGISILSRDNDRSQIYFGSNSLAIGAVIRWEYDTDEFWFNTAKAGASVVFKADNYVTNLTLSGASGFELATFAGDIGFAGANPNIIGGDTDGRFSISSVSTDVGSNIKMYGDTHASQAGDFELRDGTTVVYDYDASATEHTFVGTVRIASTIISGGSLNNPEGFAYSASVRALLVAGATSTDQANIYLHRDDVTITSGNVIGELIYSGADGVDNIGASIRAEATGTWSGSSSQSELIFATTPSGATSPVDAMTLDRDGDMVLAGGVYIGGTGSANLLDDVEEGTYTITITTGTSGTITLAALNDVGAYEKTKNFVHAHGFGTVDSVSSPVGYFTISLPFTPADLTENAGRSVPSVTVENTAAANVADFAGFINEGEAFARVYLGDATSLQSDSAQEISDSTFIYFSASFRAA